MLQTTTRIAPRLTGSLRQAIGLLSLTGAELVARLAVEAAGNPALRLIPPAGPLRPLLDPDGISAPGGSLISHVLEQIGLMRLSPRERVIALALVEGLEPTGWLSTPPAAVARACGLPEAEVLAVLARLQAMEPGGLFARTLAECLALQVEAAGQMTPAMRAVLDRLPQLAAGDLDGIAVGAGLDPAQIRQAAGGLRGLNPKPGLAFEGPMPPPVPPDLILRRAGAGWQVAAHPGQPVVDLVPGTGDLRAADAIRRAVLRRRDLALSLGRRLALRQAAHLAGQGARQPVTAADLATAEGVHVATVNRILRGVTLQTPSGTMALRDLLDRPLGPGGPSVGRVRDRLAELLAAQAGESDARLAARLTAEGLPVARRTVAKYRKALGG